MSRQRLETQGRRNSKCRNMKEKFLPLCCRHERTPDERIPNVCPRHRRDDAGRCDRARLFRRPFGHGSGHPFENLPI